MTEIRAEEPSPQLLEYIRRQRRHTLELLTVCAIGLVPWTILLAVTLPSGYTVRQWRTTWVGFDVLLLLSMAATALLGWRRHRGVVVAAVSTGALLLCDAWFDVSLALGTPDVWWSVALAVCGTPAGGLPDPAGPRNAETGPMAERPKGAPQINDNASGRKAGTRPSAAARVNSPRIAAYPSSPRSAVNSLTYRPMC